MSNDYVLQPLPNRRCLIRHGRLALTMTPPRILVVDSGSSERADLERLVGAAGMRPLGADSLASASNLMESHAIDIVICDVGLAHATGEDVLGLVARRWPGTPVIVIAPDATGTDTLAALESGAQDVLVRPVDGDQLHFVLHKALALVEHEVAAPPDRLEPKDPLIGESRALREAYAVLSRAAQGNATVLIRGESGTGKELVARALHDQSSRASRPFVKIDCAALPENLLESELFGYERGAFTGAAARKPGRVELAHTGTLFLDEIGELTPPLQAKLLRLLQDRTLERLGGTTTIAVDIRVVTATHRDLETMIQRGEFRQDLFYRLNVVPIWLPPLRARRSDIAELARHFCRQFALEHGRPDLELDDAALRALRGQRWPGNVRQLQNFIERLVVLAERPIIGEAEVTRELNQNHRFITEAERSRRSAIDAPAAATEAEVQRLSEEVRSAERRALLRALKQAGGNRSLAARLLGISRSFLYKKLDEHELV